MKKRQFLPERKWKILSLNIILVYDQHHLDKFRFELNRFEHDEILKENELAMLDATHQKLQFTSYLAEI